MELPESLDETYERILKEIKKPNKAHALRVLQCLVAATRPLRVTELAAVLAVDFDNVEGIPRLNADWQWEDQEQALLIACSSLIAIVEAGHSDLDAKTNDDDSHIEDDDSRIEDDTRIVQFSHFSVKEFLTSSRLATSSGEVSGYHIDLEPAHTILAQTCLGVLLQPQDDVEGSTLEDHSLARYAAKHWTTHAQFGEVSSRLRKEMEYLFDANKPHFKMWLTQYNIDRTPGYDVTYNKFSVAPLYYAALCGFYDLVEHLVNKNPQDVNADGGFYVRPLMAALAGGHFRTVDLLRHNGADPGILGKFGNPSNPLNAAAYSGNFEAVRIIIEHDPAGINGRDGSGSTPLHWASTSHFEYDSVLRFLLENSADITVQDRVGRTPLHWASFGGMVGSVRLLLEHGANVEAKGNDGMTALQEAAQNGRDEIVELLLAHGAK